MTITAKIIADSVAKNSGKRITTLLLRYPRFIHAELMTHRVFSRNASSSRAIPVARMIEDLRRDPAMPIYWGSNKPGMQAGEELYGADLDWVKRQWLGGMEEAIGRAEQMISAGLHKQIANRILEPWAHINVVVTATEYANWFALRNHSDAQPEIKALAEAMRKAMDLSVPVKLAPGEWHLPFVTYDDHEQLLAMSDSQEEGDRLARMVSTARCARTSFLTHDGRATTLEEDIALHDKLVVSSPLHASPAEHQATPDTYVEAHEGPYGEWRVGKWTMPHLHGNLTGWRQYRKMLPNEFVPG